MTALVVRRKAVTPSEIIVSMQRDLETLARSGLAHTCDLLTSQEEMELTELSSSLLILGGGYIALELG